MGVFSSGSWIYIFWLFLNDFYIYEPDAEIALFEMILAIFLTFILIAGLSVYIRDILKNFSPDKEKFYADKVDQEIA